MAFILFCLGAALGFFFGVALMAYWEENARPKSP